MAFAEMLSDEDIRAAVQACQSESESVRACTHAHTHFLPGTDGIRLKVLCSNIIFRCFAFHMSNSIISAIFAWRNIEPSLFFVFILGILATCIIDTSHFFYSYPKNTIMMLIVFPPCVVLAKKIFYWHFQTNWVLCIRRMHEVLKIVTGTDDRQHPSCSRGAHIQLDVFTRECEGGATQSGRGRNPLSQGTAVLFAVGAGRLQVTRQHLAGEPATRVFTLSIARAIPQSHPRALHNSSPVIMSAWHGKTQLCCSGTNQMSVIMPLIRQTFLWQRSWAKNAVTRFWFHYVSNGDHVASATRFHILWLSLMG